MKKQRLLSPIGLLALAACGEKEVFTSKGFAIKGPLSNALVFADADGDGIHDPGEEFVRTGSDGSFSLANPNKYTVVVIADEQTTNALTGEATGTFVMSGAAEDSVITPFSALQQADLSPQRIQQLAESLGLPDDFDFVNDNPFAADSGLSADEQLAFEQAASQMMATLQVTAAAVQAEAGEGALSDEAAFSLAFDAMAAEVSDRLDAGDPIDFEDTEFVADIVTETANRAASETGQAAIEVDAEQVATVIAVVNERISEVESLDDTGALAEALAGGRDTAEDIQDGGGVDSVNLRPLSLKLVESRATNAVTEIDDDMAGGESLGVMLVVDDDDVADYTFEIVGGADAAAFDIDATTGELTLAAGFDPNALTDGTLDVQVRVTENEAIGNTREVSLSIAVNNVDEGPTTFVTTVTTSTASGEVQVGKAVSVLGTAADPDGVASVTYEFRVDGSVVQSGLSNSYTPTAGDFGANAALSYVIVATDATGAVTRSSEQVVGEIFAGPNAAPEITITPTSPATDENVMAGTVVATVTASDDREGVEGYALDLSLSGADAALFTLVDMADGTFEIRTAPGFVPDFEASASYDIRITATDGVLSTQRPITVTINNLQEGPATEVFTITDQPLDGARFVGDPIDADFDGTDPDGTASVVVTFYADGDVVQSGASATYTPTADDLNKEITVSWTITDPLGAEQVVTPPESLGTVVSATNAAPVITASAAGFAADENSPEGTVFGTFTVSDDRDVLPGNSVQVSLGGADAANFALVDNGDGSFDLISAPGFVPDFEDNEMYLVQINATDGDKSSATTAMIAVNNVQEGPASFDIMISDTFEPGIQYVGHAISAFPPPDNPFADPDGTQTESYNWYVDGVIVQSGDSRHFVATGDHLGGYVTLQIVVTDPLGDVTTSEIFDLGTVYLADNHAPGMTASWDDGGTNSTVDLDENTPGGELLGVITAVDDRATMPGNVVTVDLIGTGSEFFQIVDNGDMTFDFLTAPGFVPDFEDAGIFDLTLRASDGDLSYDMPVTISINNLQEGPASIDVSAVATPPANGEIYLGLNVGPAPGDTTGFTDPDGIVSTTYNWYVDGVLSTSTEQDQYVPISADIGKVLTLQIVVTDGLGAETTSELVELGTIYSGPNQAPSVTFTTTSGDVSYLEVDENAAAGLQIGVVEVSDDRDMIAGHDVTFSLVGADAGDFRLIDMGNGNYSLNFAETLSPDFELQSDFVGQIVATDPEGLQTSYPFSVSINNLQEGPTVGDLNPTAVVYVGDPVSIAPVLSDPDGVSETAYAWQIDGVNVPGATGTTFTPGAGDKGRTLNVTVLATDALGAVTTLTYDFGTVDGDPLPAPIVSVYGFGTGPFLSEPGKITLPEETDVSGYLFPLSIDNYDAAFLSAPPQITLGGTAASFFEVVHVGGGDFELYFADGTTPDAEVLASPDFDLTITVTGPEGAQTLTSLAVEVVNLDDNPSTFTGTILGTPDTGETLEFQIEGEDGDNDAFGGSAPTISIAWYANGELVQAGDGRFLEITEELAGATIEAVATAEDASGALSEFRDSVSEMVHADVTVNAPIAELVDRVNTFKADLQALTDGGGSMLQTFDSFLGVWNVLRYNLPDDISVGPDGISFTLEALEGAPLFVELSFDGTHNFLDAFSLFKAAYDADGLKAFATWDNWADFGKMVSLNVSGEDIQGQSGDLLTLDIQENGGPNGGDQLALTVGLHDVTDPAELVVEGVINADPAAIVELGKNLADVAMDPALLAVEYQPSIWSYGEPSWLWNADTEQYDLVAVEWYSPEAEAEYNVALADFQAFEAYRENLIRGAIEDIRQVADVSYVAVGQESADAPLVALDLADVTLDAHTGNPLETMSLTFGDANFTVLEDMGLDLGLLDGIEVSLGGAQFPRSLADFANFAAGDVDGLLYPTLAAAIWPFNGIVGVPDIPVPKAFAYSFFQANNVRNELVEFGYSIDQLAIDGATDVTPDGPDVVIQADSFEEALILSNFMIDEVIYDQFYDNSAGPLWLLSEDRQIDLAAFDTALLPALGEIASVTYQTVDSVEILTSQALARVGEVVDDLYATGVSFTDIAPAGVQALSGRATVRFEVAADTLIRVVFDNASNDPSAQTEFPAGAATLLNSFFGADASTLLLSDVDWSTLGDLQRIDIQTAEGRLSLSMFDTTQNAMPKTGLSVLVQDATGADVANLSLIGDFDPSVASQVELFAAYIDAFVNAKESYGIFIPDYPEYNDFEHIADPGEREAAYADASHAYWDAVHANSEALWEFEQNLPNILAERIGAVDGFAISGLSVNTYFSEALGTDYSPTFDVVITDLGLGENGETLEQVQITLGGHLITMTGDMSTESGELLMQFLNLADWGNGVGAWNYDQIADGDVSLLFGWSEFEAIDGMVRTLQPETLVIEEAGGTGEPLLQIDANAAEAFDYLQWYFVNVDGDSIVTVDLAGDAGESPLAVDYSYWQSFAGEGVDFSVFEDLDVHGMFDLNVHGFRLLDAIEDALNPVI